MDARQMAIEMAHICDMVPRELCMGRDRNDRLIREALEYEPNVQLISPKMTFQSWQAVMRVHQHRGGICLVGTTVSVRDGTISYSEGGPADMAAKLAECRKTARLAVIYVFFSLEDASHALILVIDTANSSATLYDPNGKAHAFYASNVDVLFEMLRANKIRPRLGDCPVQLSMQDTSAAGTCFAWSLWMTHVHATLISQGFDPRGVPAMVDAIGRAADTEISRVFLKQVTRIIVMTMRTHVVPVRYDFMDLREDALIGAIKIYTDDGYYPKWTLILPSRALSDAAETELRAEYSMGREFEGWFYLPYNFGIGPQWVRPTHLYAAFPSIMANADIEMLNLVSVRKLRRALDMYPEALLRTIAAGDVDTLAWIMDRTGLVLEPEDAIVNPDVLQMLIDRGAATVDMMKEARRAGNREAAAVLNRHLTDAAVTRSVTREILDQKRRRHTPRRIGHP